MAKKKFDTNQLDPEFPAKAAEQSASAVTQNGAAAVTSQDPHATFTPETQALPSNDPVTRLFEEPPSLEDQSTKKFSEAEFGQYQNQFDGHSVPAQYQAPKPFVAKDDITRKVAKVGLPENILTAIAYIPFQIGLIAGILELFFVPKSEAKVRFHAAQGVAAHIAILVISAILGAIGKVADMAQLGGMIFGILSTVMLVVFAVKAFQGKPIHIEAVDDLTNWLEDKIKPSE